MKIIIAYASVGAGHLKAAEAIYHYLTQRREGINVRIVNGLNEANLIFRWGYIHGYNFLIKDALFLWTCVYGLTSIKALRPFIRPIVSLINYLSTKKFARLLIRESPDFIISTHFLPAEIAAYLKRIKRINSKTITVITDFGVHPFWITKGTDIYIVASSFTKELLVKEGVSSENIKETGIPIDLKFTEDYDKYALYRKFNLLQNKFTLLIMTGSFGIGPIEETVDLLHQDMQILVICARNNWLYRKLKNKNYPNVKIFGFVNNIEELMTVSDVMVTKPGGLTIAELLSMTLVPIFVSVIPGQEKINAQILENLDIGISAKDAPDIKVKVLDYKEHPEKLDNVREKIKQIRKPFATQELYNVICQGSIRSCH